MPKLELTVTFNLLAVNKRQILVVLPEDLNKHKFATFYGAGKPVTHKYMNFFDGLEIKQTIVIFVTLFPSPFPVIGVRFLFLNFDCAYKFVKYLCQ